MGAGIHDGFGKTKGSKTVMRTSSKRAALRAVPSLPKEIQKEAKKFFKGGSNKYNRFDIEKNDDGYLIKMIKPGNVPGSRAHYYKILDRNGELIRVYKETYDPKGILVHTKEK